MLSYLKLHAVGPAPKLEIDFTQRMNFLVGDNGLGKTFLLDIAWWVLTRTWARTPVNPIHEGQEKPSIAFGFDTATGKTDPQAREFDRSTQSWGGKRGRPPIPGVVIYAQVDGGFSVWDPARNYWSDAPDGPDHPRAFLFSPEEVWDGLPRDDPKKQCNGLILDVAAWQREHGEAFTQLTRVLDRLSPSEGERLQPGDLAWVSLADSREHPTLKMPYGQDVPLVQASAGMRRVVALAYLLVWTWQQHLRACKIRGSKPAREIIFLIDEVEAHLHPQWQRRIVPALLDVMEALTGSHDVPVQLITATHSPLVMASVEPHFDPGTDCIWELELVNGCVELRLFPWRRRGDVNSWLSSELFGLAQPSSVEAERAMGRALDMYRRRPAPSMAEVEEVDRELRGALSDVDHFFTRWSAFVEGIRRAS